MKPIKRVGLGLLYFNKDMPRFERCLERIQIQLVKSQLVSDIVQMVKEGASVDIARNNIVVEAMSMGLDAIIWLDTDMIYPDDALVRLVQMGNAGHLVAGGLYRRGRYPFEILTQLNGKDEWAELEDLQAAKDGGVVPVSLTAGGFTLVRSIAYRRVSDWLEEKTGNKMPWYCNWDFISTNQQTSEDSFFASLLEAAGVPVVIDPDLHAVHWNIFGPVPVVDDQPEMEWCK